MTRSTLLLLGTSVLLLSPFTALAHEHRTFQMGDKQYSVVVGLLNEPVSVDDKTGVEVLVQELGRPTVIQQPMADGGGDEGPAGVPVDGLEKTLRVEVGAGDQKKMFDLAPKEGAPGSYETVFYPTVQTTYSFRLTGMVNNLPVDVTYTCNPAGHPQMEDDTTHHKMSGAVTQLVKGGAFGCPTAKADAQFPEQAGSLYDLKHSNGGSRDTVALAMGTLGFVFGLTALGKVNALRKKQQ